jgi:hypothetical protein
MIRHATEPTGGDAKRRSLILGPPNVFDATWAALVQTLADMLNAAA